MAFRSMRNGFQALVDLGTAIEDATFGRRRRNAYNAQPMYPEDIEMDIITALNASPNLSVYDLRWKYLSKTNKGCSVTNLDPCRSFRWSEKL